MKILVAVQPVDFRRGIDGLARLCQEALQHDPFAGAVFVFRNRKATAVKLLMYDGQGFWLAHKRQASDYPHPGSFTAFCRRAHNRARRFAASGGMDPCPPPGGPGRSTMSQAAAVTAPPRARPSSDHRDSTNSGVS
ncbi:MAG: IS66 family insertion sequence element accessory protein TnpB [Gemmatimonadaceae bacterium]